MFNITTEATLVIICMCFIIQNLIDYTGVMHKYSFSEKMFKFLNSLMIVLIVSYSVFYTVYRIFQVFNIRIVMD